VGELLTMANLGLDTVLGKFGAKLLRLVDGTYGD